MNANSQMNLTIGVIVALAVAATGTYFAVDYLSGTDKAQAAAPAAPAAETTDTAAAEAAPADPGTDSNAAIEAATDAAVAAVGDGTSLSADEARRIGEEVARQVAAQVAQQIVDRSGGSSGGGTGGGLTAEEARQIGEQEGRRVAQEVAQAALANLPSGGGNSGGGMTAAEAEQIGLAAGRRAARQVAADTAREVVQNEFGGQVAASGGGSSSSAAAESSGGTEASSGADSAEFASSGAGSSSSSAAPAASSVAAAQALPKADALKPWWPGSAGGFGLVYAGQPKGEQAIALLFSGTPTPDALNQSVKVYDAKGQAVSGSWETAANPRLAVLRGLAPGRYTVVLDGALADSQGQALGKPLHGPVYVI